MKGFLRVIIFVILIAVLICLPVIPLTTAPVVPRPIYSFRMVTLLEILFSPFTLGVYYQWHWYTLVATLALLVVGYLVSRFVLRKIGAKSRD